MQEILARQGLESGGFGFGISWFRFGLMLRVPFGAPLQFQGVAVREEVDRHKHQGMSSILTLTEG